MARQSPSQRKSVGRVMHEYKHGELKSGRGGRAGKVKNPRQAIAIALHEAGASRYESKEENRRSYRRTKQKEAHGETAQQEAEGKSHVGARGRRESSRSMGGKNAKTTTRRGRRAAATRKRRSTARKSTSRRSSSHRRKSTARRRRAA
ncbi:DUF6496 domain-containing protein [Enhydrobacter sp.]|jgi:hypothetical protein|uniref:DUF6496 domain-containing protein n=1 Tax=Enhydrobacter sp. TaxID=1894999 RepID=UPI00262463D5|nr:DUF6496 domain-containing protein [Enhydrobacter sp.]WIM09792.1 MAG: hypothetical protein OJF58_000745 [Enhydrobacter sp.]